MTTYDTQDDQGLAPIGTVMRALPALSSAPAAPPDAPPALDTARPRCARCRDAGWLVPDVKYGNPAFAKPVPCAWRAAQRAASQRQALLELSHLAVYRTQTFDTFVCSAATAAVWATVQRYTERFAGWLVLLGGYGCGKTHLAAAAWAALDQGMTVLFMVVPDLLDHLRAAYAPTSAVAYDAHFERVRSVPLLVLDDLGTESATPWAREKLYQIINYRYNEQLPTIITSNRPVEAIDPRMVSRMTALLFEDQVVLIDAPDYRQRAVRTGWDAWRPGNEHPPRSEDGQG